MNAMLANLESIERIRSLDPLDFDANLEVFTTASQQKNSDALVEMLSDQVDHTPLDPNQDMAKASLRDMDFLLAAITRCGVDPVQQIPGCELTLIALGEIAQTVPRGTVETYALLNPPGQRERTFTDSEEERTFIGAVRNSHVLLRNTISKLVSVRFNDIEPHDAATHMLQAAQSVDEFRLKFMSTRKIVTPEFFTYQLRPFFEPIRVDGSSFSAAGGAQLPLVVLDRIVWGANQDDETYQDYYADAIKYLPNDEREAVDMYTSANGRTITSIFHSRFVGGDFDRKPIDALLSLYRSLIKFRTPHYRTAKDNFKLRKESAVGSGSYKPDLLEKLIALTTLQVGDLKGLVEDE